MEPCERSFHYYQVAVPFWKMDNCRCRRRRPRPAAATVKMDPPDHALCAQLSKLLDIDARRSGSGIAAASLGTPRIHVRQRRSWDCGVAALLTVLRRGDSAAWTDACEIIGTDSIWTIDLVHALRRLSPGRRFVYTTQQLGVDPRHRHLSFYHKELDADETRVQRLFIDAEACGVPIHQVTVSPCELFSFHLLAPT